MGNFVYNCGSAFDFVRTWYVRTLVREPEPVEVLVAEVLVDQDVPGLALPRRTDVSRAQILWSVPLRAARKAVGIAYLP